jgi:hypothetical protein
VLAETLAMIGRLWRALYRHKVAGMPWCSVVSSCMRAGSPKPYVAKQSWNYAKGLFRSLYRTCFWPCITRIYKSSQINRDNSSVPKCRSLFHALFNNTWVSARVVHSKLFCTAWGISPTCFWTLFGVVRP